MKKIVIILAVIFADLILLNMNVAASDHLNFMPHQYFPILLLFLTLITTLFLFYEEQLEKVHQQWHKLYTRRVDKMFPATKSEVSAQQPATTPKSPSLVKSFLLRKKETPALNLQYQFVDLVKSQIVEMQKEGKSEHEIVEVLKQQRWDAQVIYLALSRLKQEGKESS
jgi:hypothetical protein